MKSSQSILFLTNGSQQLGFGHLRRCLTLANNIKQKKHHCYFLTNSDSQIDQLLNDAPFPHYSIEGIEQLDMAFLEKFIQENQIQTLIVDSYLINKANYQDLSIKVVAIDELFDDTYCADVLINAASNADSELSTPFKKLYGPDYIILRDEFLNLPHVTINHPVNRILFVLGSGDVIDVLYELLSVISQNHRNIEVGIVLGPMFSTEVYEQVERYIIDYPKINLLENPENMAKLMQTYDLAVCAGGQTAYELAAVGVPAIAIQTADNQTDNLTLLNQAGTLVWIGGKDELALKEHFAEALTALMSSKSTRERMSQSGQALVDGQGLRRVVEVILE